MQAPPGGKQAAHDHRTGADAARRRCRRPHGHARLVGARLPHRHAAALDRHRYDRAARVARRREDPAALGPGPAASARHPGGSYVITVQIHNSAAVGPDAYGIVRRPALHDARRLSRHPGRPPGWHEAGDDGAPIGCW